MSTTRRHFLKGVGASALVFASGDMIAELLAQSPRGNVRQSRFRGLSDIVLGEATMAGCSYADVRFTMTAGVGGGSASFNANAQAGRGGGGDQFAGGGVER